MAYVQMAFLTRMQKPIRQMPSLKPNNQINFSIKRVETVLVLYGRPRTRTVPFHN